MTWIKPEPIICAYALSRACPKPATGPRQRTKQSGRPFNHLEENSMYKRILIATDGSELSEKAVEHG
ncbi:universal stress protein, partial [Acidovorax sp.]|uniref:universal stress protein n=1 Tax=Acidovorax sp. TaxID=1872122 RepID=UPI0025BA533B